MAGKLTTQQVDFFNENGYLIIEDFISSVECDRLKERAHRIIDEANFDDHPKVTFNTTSRTQLAQDYFYDSCDKISFFFEDNAFDEEGKLKYDRKHSINKVGHALHLLDPVYREFTNSDKIKNVAKSLEFKAPTIVQSMVILKPPKIGGQVGPHRDSTYLYTQPMRLLGFWLALEDATKENACLWFAPKTHKGDKLDVQLVTTSKDGKKEGRIEGNIEDVPDNFYIAGEVRKGSLVLIHGEVLHKSEMNTSEKSRNIYTFHVYDAGRSKWSSDNWLQPTDAGSFVQLY